MAFAQGEPGWNRSSLGANFELSIPVGDFSTYAGTGYGGNLRYQFGSDSRTAFTATAGYVVWGTKDLGPSTSVQTKSFNLFVGGKYYVANGFYGSLEAGAYFLTYSYTGNVIGAQGNTTRIMLPIGVGYQKSGFEVGVRYLLFATHFNSFSFTVGYNFML
ncbi:MAG TPA: hypothetical protein VK569_09625 [Bacteroidota bacterium]|nr:hypothetical protein [Bacteroidota bacterium]